MTVESLTHDEARRQNIPIAEYPAISSMHLAKGLEFRAVVVMAGLRRL
ncbi:MAG TPA: hypothetical protein PK440_12610 [Candidatus Accumulibacter phosphatis]|nr:hypothetical protein [Candidatus Accumulibacter phosphatis]HRQ95821.1 hypothetical protein [Candidatus Accumulibacter phosphatis]